MGVQRRQPALSRFQPLPGRDVAGWRRCQRDARIRHRNQILHRGRLSRSRLEIRLFLAGQGHGHCLGRLRGRRQDRVRLSARRQAVEARHPAGGRDADLRGREAGSRGRRRGRASMATGSICFWPARSTSFPRTASCACRRAKTGASRCRTMSPTAPCSRVGSCSACAARGRRRTAPNACRTASIPWISSTGSTPANSALSKPCSSRRIACRSPALPARRTGCSSADGQCARQGALSPNAAATVGR